MTGTALLTAAAVLVAGCSSSGSKSTAGGSPSTASGSSTSSGGSSAPAPTGTPIKIGLIASLTGPQASSSDQGATVGPAWADYVNKELGGISGHPVQVIVKDDQGQPTTAQAAATSLISQGVVAILAGSDNLVPAFDDITIKAGIPLISGSANAADWYTKSLMFPTVTDIASGVASQVIVAKEFGKATKFANLYCAEIAACKQAGPILQGAATKLGLGYTELAVSSTATSYTAQCLALKQKGIDYVQLDFSTDAAFKFISDCQAQGYNPTFGSSGSALGPSFEKLKNLTVFGPDFAFPYSGQSDAITTFTNVMTKYAKDDNWKASTATLVYSGLVAFQKALATVSPSATVTAKDVINGLYAFKDETLGGLSANPLNFSASKPVAYGSRPCYFIIGVADGKVTAPNGVKPVCPTG
jgi:branched-chain amino acid transport system substrate-binding protein